MSIGPGWLGTPDQLFYVLGTVNADKDSEGKFLIYGEPVVEGMDGDLLVPAKAEYSVDGKLANLAYLMSTTSYGLSGVTVFS